MPSNGIPVVWGGLLLASPDRGREGERERERGLKIHRGAAQSQDLNIGGFCVVGSYIPVAGPVRGAFVELRSKHAAVLVSHCGVQVDVRAQL